MTQDGSFHGTEDGVCGYLAGLALNTEQRSEPGLGKGPLPKIVQKSSKIQFAFNKVGPIFCAVKATILDHILAAFGVKLVGF